MMKFVSAFLLFALSCAFAVDPAQKTIPAGAKFCVEGDQGFDTFLTAALTKKSVPVSVVDDCSKADYKVSAATQSDKASWSRVVFMGQTGSNEEASMKVTNLKTSEVVFAYSVHKRNSVHGKQSSAEACAKHLKEIVH
jgi:hypothetical protein